MFVLTLTRKLYKLLSSDSSPAAIAFGVSFGALLGCVPLLSGLGLLCLLAVLVLRVQVAAALVSWGLTRLAAAAGLAIAFEPAGEALLDPEALHGLWTWFLNLPVAAWLGLERYAVLGGAVVGLALGAALFLPVRQGVIAYRRFLHESVSRSRFFRWLTNFWVVRALRFVFVGSGN